MTGANRILIGLGWSGIALFTIYRAKTTRDSAVERRPGFLTDAVTLNRDLATEITFLLAATAYAFLIPLRGGIGPIDSIVLVGLFVLYIAIVIRGDVEESDRHVGVPAYFQAYPKVPRIAVILFGFLFSGAIIFHRGSPFAEGARTVGAPVRHPGVLHDPVARAAGLGEPGLIVVAYLVNKARSTAGFNTLISSKLNQWTLLIGTLAIVYSISAGAVGTLSFDAKQAAEIWITAAQSFAIAIIVNFEINVRGRSSCSCCSVRRSSRFYVIRTYAEPAATEVSMTVVLYAYTAVYAVIGVALFVKRRKSASKLVRRAISTARTAL